MQFNTIKITLQHPASWKDGGTKQLGKEFLTNQPKTVEMFSKE